MRARQVNRPGLLDLPLHTPDPAQSAPGPNPPNSFPSSTKHVFISYSHHEAADYVKRLARYLSNLDIPVWYDHEIITGHKWANVIRERIHTSSAVIVVMTPMAEHSDWVSNEIAEAQDYQKAILPLLLKGNRFFSLASLQYVDVTSGIMPGDNFVAQLRALLTEPRP